MKRNAADLTDLVGDQGGVLTTAVETGAEAVELAGANEFDCVVLTSSLARYDSG